MATGVTEVTINERPVDVEIIEEVQVTTRQVNVVIPELSASLGTPHLDETDIVHSKRRAPEPPQAVVTSGSATGKSNLVVREVRLKSFQPPAGATEVVEVMQKSVLERQVPPLVLHDTTSTASDSDVERGIAGAVIEPITSSTPKRPPTDSEELKRKAASLGDLSRLHTEPEVINVVLERAMSLDLTRAEATTAAENVPNLQHPRRLQLPDSSATSIDEEDEVIGLRVDGGMGLRRAGQWGTLEEALQFRRHSDLSLAEAVSPRVTEPEGEPVSHIEISGSTSITDISSTQWVTASETSKSITLHHREDEDQDEPPALPSTPAPVGGTTITLLDGDATITGGSVEVTPVTVVKDTGVVVVQANPPTAEEKQVSNFTVQLRNVTTQETHTTKTIPTSSSSSSRSSLSSDSEVEGIAHHEGGNVDGVTVTVAPRVSSVDISGPTSITTVPPPVPPKPRGSRAQSPPQLVVPLQEPALVTVRENGAVVVTTDSPHVESLTLSHSGTITREGIESVILSPAVTNIESVTLGPTITREITNIEGVTLGPSVTRETIVVESSENGSSFPTHLLRTDMSSLPQKSLTQITVDGGGYTVTEGALSRTLIISTPATPAHSAPGPDSPPPTLQPPQ